MTSRARAETVTESNARLVEELFDARETLRAIRSGGIDAVITTGPTGDRVSLIDGADVPYRRFVEAMSEGAITVADDGTILYANRRFLAMTSTTLNDIVGSNLRSWFIPADSDAIAAGLASGTDDGSPLDLRLARGAAEGHAIHVTMGRLALDNHSLMYVLATDVEEQRLSDSSRHMQAHLLDAAGEAVIATDPAGTISYVNRAAEILYGWGEGEMLGRSITETTPPQASSAQASEVMDVIRRGDTWSGEVDVQRKDGTIFAALVTDTPLIDNDGVLRGIIGISRDITERRSAETRLEASERWFRALIQHSTDIITVVSADGRVMYASPAAETVLGYPPETLVGSPALDFIHADDLARAAAGLTANATSTSLPETTTVRARTASGEWVYLEIVTTVLLDDPAVNGIVSNARDVTQAHLATEALARSEALLREAQSVTHVGHWQLDVQTQQIEWLADEMFAIHGLERQAWAGSLDAYLKLVHPEDVEAARLAMQRAVETGEADITHRIVRHDGVVRWVRKRSRLEHRTDGAHVFGTCQDVTDQKTVDDALERANNHLREVSAERHSLLHEIVTAQEAERGRIASDIHDDSIQAVVAAKLRLGVIRRHLTDLTLDGQLALFSDALDEAIVRLRRLVFQLRPRSLDTEGLAEAFRESLVQWTGEAGVEFTIENAAARQPDADQRVILFRIGQEAFANIRKHANAQTIDVALVDLDDGVLLRISDDGVGMVPPGIDASVRGHIGIASMAERAELAGGWCRVTSPAKGTTVEAWLPIERNAAGETS